jgi:DNA-binding LacI/PurR family transcriptional regulator
MNKLPERIRIKDIARLADVSVGTVDRVIHSRSGVSEASKKRVEEILKQLDYQPNMYASALASNKKYTFICLLPEQAGRRKQQTKTKENSLSENVPRAMVHHCCWKLLLRPS